MASIYDVAKKAGVSKTLVSRVINGKSGVSERSREKIIAAMEELKFTPSAIARSLVLQKTGIIGVVMDSLCEPYFFDFIRGIENQVEAAGYDVIFCSSRDSAATKQRYIDFFRQGRADGFILYGSSLEDQPLIQQLENAELPFVVVEYDVEELNINNICVDNQQGSETAVNYLVRKGARHICHVTGDLKTKAGLHRKEGYIRAMEQNGLPCSESDVLEGGFSVSAGYQAVAGYLQRHGVGDLPDAFYFGADNAAYGGLMALEDKGIDVPRQVMVVGFDNDTVCIPGRLLKRLTTLAQPMTQMGEAAVKLLVKEIQSPSLKKEKVMFYPELILGETTR